MCTVSLKDMSEEKGNPMNFFQCKDHTAKVPCINKPTVSHICREAKK
jgi:hypothetical protein